MLGRAFSGFWLLLLPVSSWLARLLNSFHRTHDGIGFFLFNFLRPAAFLVPALAHHRRIITGHLAKLIDEKHGEAPSGKNPRRQSFLRLRTTNCSCSNGPNLDGDIHRKGGCLCLLSPQRRYDGGNARTRALELLEGDFYLPTLYSFALPCLAISDNYEEDTGGARTRAA